MKIDTMLEKIIMYDSDEAAKLVTVTAYQVNSPNNILYTPIESQARYNNCTHKTCECGKPMRKHYTKCEWCREVSNRQRYMALLFKEFDGTFPVCDSDGGKYFWSEDELTDYMVDEDLREIDLLFCVENKWHPVNEDYWEDYMPEDGDGELPKELKQALDNLNEVISKLPAQSYSPGKVRTTFTI